MEKSKKNTVKLVPGSILILIGTILLLLGIPQGLLFILIGGLFVYSYSKTKSKIKKDRKETVDKELKKIKDREDEVQTQIKKLNEIQKQINNVSKIITPSISDFKSFVIKNEKVIQEKGGDEHLFKFLKVDSFLNDFRFQIQNDINQLNEIQIVDDLKSQIIQHSKKSSLERLSENLNDSVNRMDGQKGTGLISRLDQLDKLGQSLTPTLNRQIETLNFYVSMSMIMVDFYLNDNKVRYFEIYSSFEKLGVFDSTFQKNVLGKLSKIEIRLSSISNELTNLNKNFELLVDSSESIINELKGINEGINKVHLSQWINIYQNYKINKNTKSLRG
jgi:cell division protein FtsB